MIELDDEDLVRAYDAVILMAPYLRADVTAAERATIAADIVACVGRPLRRMLAAHAPMKAALELPLLFHAGGLWDDDKRARWKEITGTEEATTRVMCNTVRSALGIPKAARGAP